MTMTNWIYILSTFFESKYTKKELRNIIVSQCLSTPNKIYGSYCVDDQKVWDKIVVSDSKLKEQMNTHRISDYAGVIELYEQLQYKTMRSTYPRKKRR